MNYSFELPLNEQSIIKVVGVGGGGGNAVNHMYRLGIRGVEFVICNTDSQALANSPVPTKIQLGRNVTQGLGAGADPSVGRMAAEESYDDIRDMFGNATKMAFITAGMGGGTGTGAAPIIAGIARELGILTVGIVTSPFRFEGPSKIDAAYSGIRELKDNCDIVLVISNDRIREAYGKLKMKEAFAKCDDVLANAAHSIAEIITKNNTINIDFRDVNTTIQKSQSAVMGSAIANGPDRAIRAVEKALESPLLENNNIFGAKKVLLYLAYAEDDLDMDELEDITQHIMNLSGGTADVIWGYGEDHELQGDDLKVTIIATGFETKEEEVNPVTRIHDLNTGRIQDIREEEVSPKFSNASFQTPQPKSVDPQPRYSAPRAENTYEPRVTPVNQPAQNPVNRQNTERVSQHVVDMNSSANVREDSQNQRTSIHESQINNETSMNFGSYEIIDLDSNDNTPRSTTHQALPNPRENNFRGENVPRSQPSTPQYPSMPQNQPSSIVDTRKKYEEEAEKRMRRLNEMKQSYSATNENLDNMFNVPAYKRRGVGLNESESLASDHNNISKYNVNDDNEILGNNRFLHGNVD